MRSTTNDVSATGRPLAQAGPPLPALRAGRIAGIHLDAETPA